MASTKRSLSKPDYRNTYDSTPLNRPDGVNQIRHNEMAIQNAVGSMGLLIQLLDEELEAVRMNIREKGIRMRRFIRENLHLNFETVLQRLTRFLLRFSKRVPLVLEGNDAISLGRESSDAEFCESSNPKPSLLDIVKVLMTDEVEDGVLRSFQLHSKPWESLPLREKEEIEEVESISEFQLFNRPMTMDDEEERLSIPSTLQTEAEHKINNLETQLAALTRQMQSIMANKITEKPKIPLVDSPGSSVSSDAGIHLPTLSTVSDEEIHSPEIKRDNKENVLPDIRPPPGPPPPPPPSMLGLPLKASSPKLIKKSEARITPPPLNFEKDIEAEERKSVVRPSIMDIKAVQLRKTNTARSPGGTPVPLGRRPLREARDGQCMDNGEFLANALRNKFRSVQTSFCEADDEDGNSSWADNDDE